jgi:hypothetical protein
VVLVVLDQIHTQHGHQPHQPELPVTMLAAAVQVHSVLEARALVALEVVARDLMVTLAVGTHLL